MSVIIQNIQMEADQNSSACEVQSQQSANIDELRRKIELSNTQLLELTYNDEKFIVTIENLNNLGIKSIHNQQNKEALVYFNENEKILQYAASCGKTIDRSVILVTLHNQACVHQKLWDLQRSANYLQAILYNLKFYLENSQAKRLEHERKVMRDVEELITFTRKKQNYALYHLQFCAVNSQVKKHNISISSAKQTIKIMKQVCRVSSLLEENLTIQNKFPEPSTNSRNFKYQKLKHKNMLKQLANLDQNLSLKNYDYYLKQVKKLIRDREKDSQAEINLKDFRNFSIGKLMQINPITLRQMQCKPNTEQFFSYQSKILRALYLGISYFTVGTQLRFLSSQKNESEGEEEVDHKLSEDFLLSEVYHIFAILIVLNYVPVDTIFLNHLLTSFNNHYLIDLQKLSEKEKKNLSPLQLGIIPESETFYDGSLKKSDQIILRQQSQIKTPSIKRFLMKESRKSQMKKSQSQISKKNSSKISYKKEEDKSNQRILAFKKNSKQKRSSRSSKQEKLSAKKSPMKNKVIHNIHNSIKDKSQSPLQPLKFNNDKKKSKKKSISSQRKTITTNRSKKNCIYTNRDERDKNLSSSPQILKSSKSKQKSSKHQNKSKQNVFGKKTMTNRYNILKNMVHSINQKSHSKKILQKSKSKGKIKNKKTLRNDLERDKVKKQQKSKSKPKKPKIKMMKVQVSHLVESQT